VFETTALPDLVSSPGLRKLLSGLADVRAQDATTLPPAQALAEAAAVLRALQQLEAVGLRRLADVDMRELFALDGAPSTGTWVEQLRVGLSRSAVALARRLARLTTVAACVEEGSLCRPAAERIGEALDRVRPHLDRPDGLLDGHPAEEVLEAVVVDGVAMLVAQARGSLADDDPVLLGLRSDLRAVAAAPLPAAQRVEAAFVRLAQEVEPAQVRPALAQLVDALLPQQLEAAAERGHRERSFDLWRLPDGSGWTARGQLDLETGELLTTVLAAEQATDPDNPCDTAAFAELRQDLLPSQTPRSARQRRHDALRLGLRRLLDCGALGRRDKVAPHLAVTTPLPALAGRPGALPATGSSGGSLPASLVRRWMCDSRVTRFVLGLGGRVLEVSHTERTLKPHERKALEIQWGGQCAGAGCIRGPGHRMVPHHATPFAVCGTTSLSDTVPLCEATHHDLHEGRRVLRLKDGRWLGPDGWCDGPDG
jgi:Domain of unknown function (DUF222)